VDRNRESGEDFVDACLEPTKALKECMEANTEYYAPLLVRAYSAHSMAQGSASIVSGGRREPGGCCRRRRCTRRDD